MSAASTILLIAALVAVSALFLAVSKKRAEDRGEMRRVTEDRTQDVFPARLVLDRTVSNLNRELEQTNRNLNEAVNRLSALNQISRMLGMERDRREIYRMVAALPQELLQAEICHLLMLDKNSQNLILEYSQGIGENQENKRVVPIGSGLAGWVASHRKPLLVQDFSRQDIFSKTSTMGYERRTAISVPIMIRDELMGVLTLINKRNHEPFTEEEKTLLATIASEAAMALHNALLMEKIQKNYFAIIQSLITAVEAKDIYTRGHSERVTQYSLLIAEQMGFSMGQLEVVQQAGILHDLGKLAVDLSILNKTSSLAKHEYDTIKHHPLVGYRIIEPIDFEEKVKLAVLQHHERMDGKGYPHGRTSDQILIESRILSVADAFDAMTTKRPYRDAFSIPRALQEMEHCSGTQFDPQVVEVFNRVVRSMTATGATRFILSPHEGALAV